MTELPTMPTENEYLAGDGLEMELVLGGLTIALLSINPNCVTARDDVGEVPACGGTLVLRRLGEERFYHVSLPTGLRGREPAEYELREGNTDGE